MWKIQGNAYTTREHLLQENTMCVSFAQLVLQRDVYYLLQLFIKLTIMWQSQNIPLLDTGKLRITNGECGKWDKWVDQTDVSFCHVLYGKYKTNILLQLTSTWGSRNIRHWQKNFHNVGFFFVFKLIKKIDCLFDIKSIVLSSGLWAIVVWIVVGCPSDNGTFCFSVHSDLDLSSRIWSKICGMYLNYFGSRTLVTSHFLDCFWYFLW